MTTMLRLPMRTVTRRRAHAISHFLSRHANGVATTVCGKRWADAARFTRPAGGANIYGWATEVQCRVCEKWVSA